MSATHTLASIEAFLAETSKTAEAHTEPGSQGGTTTHPSKSVDDQTQTATEGARAAENTRDVKKDQGPPSVDSTAEATAKKADNGGTAAADQVQIGTKKGPTGTDVPSAKPGKADPGSTHPARTDNNALNGGKYAASDIEHDPLEKLAAELTACGDHICAALTVELTEMTKAAGDPSTGASPVPATSPQSAIDPKLAQAAGWELAGLISGNFDKAAADALVQNFLVDTIKTATTDATNVADHLDGYFAAQRQQQKAADGPPPPPVDPGAGGPPPMMPPPGAGGPPDPGAGGPPAGGPPRGADGGGDEEAQLMAVLQELNIKPEELIAALTSGSGGPPGAGGPPGMGGPPPGAGGPMPPPGAGGPPGAGMEVAASDRSRASKEAMAAVVSEIVGRSRIKKAAQLLRKAV